MKIKDIFSFEEYEAFIRDIASDEAFSDPHFVYAENNLYDAPSKPGMHAYAVTDGKCGVVGLFAWLVIENERYIELITGLSRRQDAYAAMLEHIEGLFPHCRMDFVVNPKNVPFREVLERKGASFENEQMKMICEAPAMSAPSRRAFLLDDKHTEQYRAIHDDDAYWTSDRILAAKDRFRVFAVTETDRIVGYLDVTYCFEENEPYALGVDENHRNQGYELSLLYEALKMNSPNKMMVLVDVDDNYSIDIYKSAGFKAAEGQNSIYATYTP